MIYDFIEIGTSDFDTLTQTSDENKIGLCIEPIQFYLDNLPNKKNIKKICIGISNCNKNEKIFYVRPENIEKYSLPYWLRGCNSIARPHYQHMNLLNGDMLHILESQDVEIISTKDMISRYHIEGVKYLKVDTEGHDYIILLDYLEQCKKNNKLFPNKITFETNDLTSPENTERVISGYIKEGYSILEQTDNTTLIKDI